MRYSLNGEWNLRSETLNLQCAGIVPGSVYGDLLRNKLIEDPFDQDNEASVRDLMNHDFTYTREFTLDASDLLRTNYLVCEGIDTLGEIFVNGNLLSTTDNMHRTWRFLLDGFVREGSNSLKIKLKSCLKYIREKDQNCAYPLYQARDAVLGFIHIRKGSSMFGWDWGPQLPDAGIWRNIFIDSVEGAYLDDVILHQDHSEANLVRLSIAVSGIPMKDGKASVFTRVQLFDPTGSLIYEAKKALNAKENFFVLVQNPLKWYPIGYGKQPLYTLLIALIKNDKTLEEKRLTVGLRETHVKRENDAYGQSFTFVVNGIEVFGKGSDYIPEDNLLGRTNKELTRDLLQSAVDANHNMIRVWGGGIYPADYFFDLCDELGILVWQDMMFACAVYDMNDEAWVSTMKVEIADNLKRMRHHACISLICGNNENETAIEHWNVPSKELSMQFYRQQYDVVVAGLVREYAPDLDWWPSSPSSGETFKDSNSDRFGDMHYWGVWHNNEPISWYRKYFPRFMSEFGIQSFPCLKTIKTFAREKDLNIFSDIMEQHQKNNTANDKILNYIGKMFRYPKDFSSLLYVSQLIQAEGVRYGVEHWRRNYGRCMGALYWQLNDCWPVASWSGIDYFHRWKTLHYHSKKFYQPILLSIAEEGTNASIHITNDTLQVLNGIVSWRLYDFDGKILQADQLPAAVQKQSAQKITDLSFTLDRKTAMATVLYACFSENGHLIAENQVSFAPDKHLKLKKPVITIQTALQDNRVEITLVSDQFAKYVELSLGEEDAIFSDNYFFLIPNQPKKITMNNHHSVQSIQGKLLLRSLVDTY